MKKILAFLVVLTVVIGTYSFAAAKTAPTAQTVEKQGIVKSFSATSLTVIENGKPVVYNLMKDAKIIQVGNEVVFTESVRKGMLIKYKVQDKKGVIFVELPGAGLIYEGVPGTSISSGVNTTIAYQETPVSTIKKNANSMIEATQLTVGAESQVQYNTFFMQSASVIYIGNVLLVPGSIKLSIGGIDIKIINSDTKFDASTAGDEAQLVVKSGVHTLNLETALTDEQQKNIDNIVKFSYKQKEFPISRLELNNMLVNENVYSELNGKEVSFAKAMYRGNYGIVETNDKSEIVYVNFYYKDLPCTATMVENKKIGINGIKNGNPAFIDVLEIDPGCTVQDINGKEISLDDIYIGSSILITTAPETGYKVCQIIVLD